MTHEQVIDGSFFINSKTLLNILEEVNVSAFGDKWGPEEVLHVYDPETQLQGVLVIDNTVLGPGKGGIRITPAITPYGVFKLARIMTWKSALAEVPFGGAQAGIRADPYRIDKKKQIELFAKKIAPFVPSRYISGPDLNIGAYEMKKFVESIGDLQGATGKPDSMGGIPNRLGSVGFGMGIALETALKILPRRFQLPDDISGLTVVIQGFGSLGNSISKFLFKKGAKIIAINDFWGGTYNASGLDIIKIQKHSCAQTEKLSVKHFKDGQSLSRDEVYRIKCDIFIPCAGMNAINDQTMSLLNCKCILEGANSAVIPNAERFLNNRNTVVIPDILANAGGVISSFAEYKKMDSYEAFSLIENKIRKKTYQVFKQSLEMGLLPREVARNIAEERILSAMG